MDEQIKKEKAVDIIVKQAELVARDWIKSLAEGLDRHPYHTDQMYMLCRMAEDLAEVQEEKEDENE